MLKVVDNLVSEGYADEIERICKTEIPWFWNENISGYENSEAESAKTEGFQFGFAHMALVNGISSQHLQSFLPLLYFMEDRTGIKVNKLHRVRLALNTWTSVETQHHAHVDMHDPHKVLLYYVNDSDGDTFMYNEMFEQYKQEPKTFTLKERISPKKNRAVIFDGFRYHSSSKPNHNSSRFIVNIDFE